MSERKILEKADREEELNNLRNWKLYCEGMYARTHHEKYKLTADKYQKQIDDILEKRRLIEKLEKDDKIKETHDKLKQYKEVNEFLKGNKKLIYDGLKGAQDILHEDSPEIVRKAAAESMQEHLENHSEVRRKKLEKQIDLFEDNSS